MCFFCQLGQNTGREREEQGSAHMHHCLSQGAAERPNFMKVGRPACWGVSEAHVRLPATWRAWIPGHAPNGHYLPHG